MSARHLPKRTSAAPRADEFRLLLATTRPAVHEFFDGLRRHASLTVDRIDVAVDALAEHEEELAHATIAAVDVGLDPPSGVEVCQELQRRRQDLPVSAILCCSQSVTPWTMRALIGAGISSVLDLQTPSAEALRALRSVARGGAVLHLQSFAGRRDLRDILTGGDLKSGAHIELLGLVAQGFPDHEIGRRLHLSPHTVKHHIEDLRAQVRARNRIELAAWAGRNGFYPPEPRGAGELRMSRGGSARSRTGHSS